MRSKSSLQFVARWKNKFTKPARKQDMQNFVQNKYGKNTKFHIYILNMHE